MFLRLGFFINWKKQRDSRYCNYSTTEPFVTKAYKIFKLSQWIIANFKTTNYFMIFSYEVYVYLIDEVIIYEQSILSSSQAKHGKFVSK